MKFWDNWEQKARGRLFSDEVTDCLTTLRCEKLKYFQDVYQPVLFWNLFDLCSKPNSLSVLYTESPSPAIFAWLLHSIKQQWNANTFGNGEHTRYCHSVRWTQKGSMAERQLKWKVESTRIWKKYFHKTCFLASSNSFSCFFILPSRSLTWMKGSKCFAYLNFHSN